MQLRGLILEIHSWSLLTREKLSMRRSILRPTRRLMEDTGLAAPHRHSHPVTLLPHPGPAHWHRDFSKSGDCTPSLLWVVPLGQRPCS
ncbi:hypothetical protein AAFF_G00087000 [Aldrovandia affinis]|uniref:Uncharacterized protein n=1 Tax=Aldrovandia affinis TaxID=143900 RepID=A0AAD7R1L5_9TELE|nr:hypothetical protein AAFF_G00087000 [Aldrovandia affinis]